MKHFPPRALSLIAWIVTILVIPSTAPAQTLSGSALVSALKRGGYVLVLRHASSPREAPDERMANPDNVTRERQLDEAGRVSAAAMGEALRALAIPIGGVLTSPTYRARETVRLAQWPGPQSVAELGDRGQSMQGVTEADGAWLRSRVMQFPAGTNTILVTHLPNTCVRFHSTRPVWAMAMRWCLDRTVRAVRCLSHGSRSLSGRNSDSGLGQPCETSRPDAPNHHRAAEKGQNEGEHAPEPHLGNPAEDATAQHGADRDTDRGQPNPEPDARHVAVLRRDIDRHPRAVNNKAHRGGRGHKAFLREIEPEQGRRSQAALIPDQAAQQARHRACDPGHPSAKEHALCKSGHFAGGCEQQQDAEDYGEPSF
jgi:phosphohistidine phosphatase SixA